MGVVAPPCADHPANFDDRALLYWLQVWIPIATQIRVIIIAAMPSAAPGPDSDERYSVPVTSSETLPVTDSRSDSDYPSPAEDQPTRVGLWMGDCGLTASGRANLKAALRLALTGRLFQHSESSPGSLPDHLEVSSTQWVQTLRPHS